MASVCSPVKKHVVPLLGKPAQDRQHASGVQHLKRCFFCCFQISASRFPYVAELLTPGAPLTGQNSKRLLINTCATSVF